MDVQEYVIVVEELVVREPLEMVATDFPIS
jgi:hypothetical protein